MVNYQKLAGSKNNSKKKFKIVKKTNIYAKKEKGNEIMKFYLIWQLHVLLNLWPSLETKADTTAHIKTAAVAVAAAAAFAVGHVNSKLAKLKTAAKVSAFVFECHKLVVLTYP